MLSMHFGLVPGSLEEQLNDQGYTLGSKAETYEKIYDSIVRVYMYDLITREDFNMIVRKFYQYLEADAKKVNRETQIQTD
jgi:hypothetical protein